MVKNNEESVLENLRSFFDEGCYLEALGLSQSDENSGFTLRIIGNMFHFGIGVDQQFDKAKSLYEASLKCQHFLGGSPSWAPLP